MKTARCLVCERSRPLKRFIASKPGHAFCADVRSCLAAHRRDVRRLSRRIFGVAHHPLTPDMRRAWKAVDAS